MPSKLGIGTRLLVRVALALGSIASPAMAQSVEGPAYRERMALPAGAAFEAVACVPRRTEPCERFAIEADRLVLSDAKGTRLAAFAAVATGSGQPASSELLGTSWQLVNFQGGEDTTLAPDDRAKYTIEFAPGGRLTARIDCNRGRGTWTSSGPSRLEFGPLAPTRANCPAGSLHDQIVKQWGFIRSYVMKDGHLLLSLMTDGGIYEFEPLTKTKG